jgi:hypothetical protein
MSREYQVYRLWLTTTTLGSKSGLLSGRFIDGTVHAFFRQAQEDIFPFVAACAWTRSALTFLQPAFQIAITFDYGTLERNRGGAGELERASNEGGATHGITRMQKLRSRCKNEYVIDRLTSMRSRVSLL